MMCQHVSGKYSELISLVFQELEECCAAFYFVWALEEMLRHDLRCCPEIYFFMGQSVPYHWSV
jgi:hypothetical protein